MARVSIEHAGAILVADSLDQACEFVDRFAPEHLSLPKNAEKLLKKIKSAGTVFIGPWGAQPLGTMPQAATTSYRREAGHASAAAFPPPTL